MITRKSYFISEGERCAASLHLPERVNSSRNLPSILMIYGWGGIQNSFLVPFRNHFVKLGFAVMTFDFRTWGESAGSPRHLISVPGRLADAEAALAHLRTQPDIDPSAIILWGSSLGGGMAFTLGEKHPELKGIIAQVPLLDGKVASSRTPLRPRLRIALYALVDSLRGSNPLYVPIVAPEGSFGTMTRDNAVKAKEEGARIYGPGAPNFIAARSALTMLSYRPIRSLGQVVPRTLVIGGTSDTIAPFDEKAVRAFNNPSLEIVTIDASHFEPYLEPHLSRNLAIQSAFLATLVTAAKVA
ncbi:hypothetical protein AO265_31135 [Pseudomonas sp. ABAC61]|nr:hypothetical protein AO265_31135 [Pseudomonas sp. ABAC61]